MVFKFFLFSLFFLMALLEAKAQSNNPVTWDIKSNTTVENGALIKTTGGRAGYAISSQVLNGSTDNNVSEGYFEFTIKNRNDLKKLGFVNLDNPLDNFDGIAYGFSFYPGGKFSMLTPDAAAPKQGFDVNDVFRLEKAGDYIQFIKNGVLLLQSKVDISETFSIKAKLISSQAKFENIVTSYSSTEFKIIPMVDNLHQEVQLAISGANEPYSYKWETGTMNKDVGRTEVPGAPISFLGFKGNHSLVIEDQNQNKITRMFSTGNDVVWSNIVGASYTGGVLLKDNSNSWGIAIHDQEIYDSSTAWLEYIASNTDGQKAVGFSNVNLPIQNTLQIEAGFLLSDNLFQIISDGQIIYSSNYRKYDVFNVRVEEGEFVWFKNGIDFLRKERTKSGNIEIVGMVKDQGKIDNLSLNISPISVVNSSWDSEIEKGTIDIDVTSLNASGPYHYKISTNQIDDLKTSYTYIKDSIQIPIDSAVFFTGTNANSTHTFSNLNEGSYHVAVFDSEQRRLYGGKLDVFPNLSFENQSGLTLDDHFIETTVSGAGSLNSTIFTSDESSISMNIERVKGNERIFFGLVDDSVIVESYNNLKFGIYQEGNKLYTVENGVKSSDYRLNRTSSDVKIKIIQENGVPKGVITKDAVAVLEKTLSKDQFLKVGVGKDHGPKTSVINIVSGKKFKVTYWVDSYINCEGTNKPKFSFNITTKGSSPGQSVTYTVLNQTTGEYVVQNNTSLLSGGTSGTIVSIDEFLNGSLLTTGEYVVSGLITIGPNDYPFSFEICLGYESEWNNVVDYSFFPNTFSVLRTIPENGNYSAAKSDNRLLQNQSGWIEFTPKTTAGTSSIFPQNHNFIRLTTLNPLSTVPLGDEDYIYFGELSSGDVLMFVYASGTGSNSIYIDKDSRIKLKSTPTQFEIFVNQQLVISVPTTPQTRVVRPGSLVKQNGFENVITSFNCGLKNTNYAMLGKKESGGLVKTEKGILNIYFEEDYGQLNVDNITIKIFDFRRNEYVVDHSFIYRYDDNRYSLDLNPLGLMENEKYYLEITVSKDVKKYIKFRYNK